MKRLWLATADAQAAEGGAIPNFTCKGTSGADGRSKVFSSGRGGMQDKSSATVCFLIMSESFRTSGSTRPSDSVGQVLWELELEFSGPVLWELELMSESALELSESLESSASESVSLELPEQEPMMETAGSTSWQHFFYYAVGLRTSGPGAEAKPNIGETTGARRLGPTDQTLPHFAYRPLKGHGQEPRPHIRS